MNHAQAQSAIATAPEPKAEGAGVAPVLMAAAMTLIGGFGVTLAARAPDDFGYVAGFALLLFAYLLTLRYFGARV